MTALALLLTLLAVGCGKEHEGWSDLKVHRNTFYIGVGFAF